jgi:hypothetical protein
METPELDLNLTVADGKYTVQRGPQTNLRALRYGEPWRDLVGDNLIFYLAFELQEAREKLAKLEGGGMSSSYMKLDDLIAWLQNAKEIASGKTCVSFDSLMWGATSLWYQTHRDNGLAAMKHPNALSAFMLKELKGGIFTGPKFIEQVMVWIEERCHEIEMLRAANQAAVTQEQASRTEANRLRALTNQSIKALQHAVRDIGPSSEKAPCHIGICSEEKCARCTRAKFIYETLYQLMKVQYESKTNSAQSEEGLANAG